MKRLSTFIALSLIAGTAAIAQLDTASPLYLSYVAGSVFYGEESPYFIPKKVAAGEDSFRQSGNLNYKSAYYGGAEFAVFKNHRDKHHAYQIISTQSNFTLLCEHYVEEICDCFEGLHILVENSSKPSRVRSIWPFSLKANLVDEIEAISGNALPEDNFETVCEILEYLEKP